MGGDQSTCSVDIGLPSHITSEAPKYYRRHGERGHVTNDSPPRKV